MFLSLFPIPLQLKSAKKSAGRGLAGGWGHSAHCGAHLSSGNRVRGAHQGHWPGNFLSLSCAALFYLLLSCFRDGVTQNKSQAKAFLYGRPHTLFHSIFCNAFCRPCTTVCFCSLMLLFEGIKCFQSYP